MAPRKSTTPTTRATSATRGATLAANAARSIDFGTSRTAADLDVENAASRSSWVRRLEELLEGVVNGAGQLDTFYLIGEFSTAGGARTVIRSVSNRPLPAAFDLRARVTRGEDGQRTSELWAAVVSENADAASDDNYDEADAA